MVLESNELKAGPAVEASTKGEVDRVYQMLKDWILKCDFQPGSFLAEVDLARRCETSRTPIREACNSLSKEGWILRIRHKGYMIPAISIRDIVETYEYRKLLECFNARKAAHTATAEQIAKLRLILEVENRPKALPAEILAANDAFHMGIAEITPNLRVLDQMHLTLDYVHRLDVLSTQRDTGWIPHGEILAALEAHKSALASMAMAAHIDHSRDRMLRLFGTR
jgi:DNA-binding GntR family transcriptional regulator